MQTKKLVGLVAQFMERKTRVNEQAPGVRGGATFQSVLEPWF
jgi:hypothetical protein